MKSYITLLRHNFCKIIVSTSLVLTLILINTLPASAVADTGGGGSVAGTTTTGSATANKIQCGVLDNLPGGINLCDRQGPNALNSVINDIANFLIGMMGLVLAIVIIVSAIQIVTSGGSPEAMKSAKNRLMQAAISLGLLISFRAIIALLGIN